MVSTVDGKHLKPPIKDALDERFRHVSFKAAAGGRGFPTDSESPCSTDATPGGLSSHLDPKPMKFE